MVKSGMFTLCPFYLSNWKCAGFMGEGGWSFQNDNIPTNVKPWYFYKMRFLYKYTTKWMFQIKKNNSAHKTKWEKNCVCKKEIKREWWRKYKTYTA